MNVLRVTELKEEGGEGTICIFRDVNSCDNHDDGDDSIDYGDDKLIML